MIVTPGLNVGIGHEEYGEDDGDNIPSRQNQTWGNISDTWRGAVRVERRSYLKVSATDPIFSGACQAEKATIAGT